jgi:hypothetical protein
MATAPPPDTLCKEATIPLLKNEEALCWFDSGNFALFHKRRPELDLFFESAKGKEEGWKIVKEVYDHFSGTKIINGEENLKGLIKRFRESVDLQNIFDSKVGGNSYKVKKAFTKRSSIVQESRDEAAQSDIEFKLNDVFEIPKKQNSPPIYGVKRVIKDIDYTVELTEAELIANFEKITKGAFSLNSGDTNDVMDYIQGYIRSNIFNTLNKNTTSFLSDIQTNTIKVLDIVNESLQITENTYTIFVDTGYNKTDKNQQNYPEEIVIPLSKESKDNNTLTFTLDAIVVHTGGVHYYVLVRCGETKDWILYDDTDPSLTAGGNLSAQVKQNIFSSFPAKYSVSRTINQTAKLLIYSRKPAPASTA